MAKSSTNTGNGELENPSFLSKKLDASEVAVDTVSIPTYNKSSKVRLRSLREARLVYTGQTSGKQYVWNKAGDITDVDALDSEILLAKRISIGCCGNSRDGKQIFEVA